MSRSFGTGSPVWFRCTKCRSTLNPDRRAGDITRVRLTGRERPRRRSKHHPIGSRSTHVAREYECLDCGHVGWSTHVDLARKAAA